MFVCVIYKYAHPSKHLETFKYFFVIVYMKGRFSYRESLTPLKAAEGSPDIKSGAEKGIEE